MAVCNTEKFSQQTFVDVQSRNTKKFREVAQGNDMVFTAKERSETERLQDAVFRNEQALKLLTDCNFEVPQIGMIDGLPFRGKADVLCGDRIVDLKTSSSTSPETNF